MVTNFAIEILKGNFLIWKIIKELFLFSMSDEEIAEKKRKGKYWNIDGRLMGNYNAHIEVLKSEVKYKWNKTLTRKEIFYKYVFYTTLTKWRNSRYFIVWKFIFNDFLKFSLLSFCGNFLWISFIFVIQ